MKKTSISALVAASVFLGTVLAACQSQPTPRMYPVVGTIDAPLLADTAPQKVRAAIDKCGVDCFERVMHDEVIDVSVWSLLHCGHDVSSDGYGIVIEREKVRTFFPNIRHGRNPMAYYDVLGNSLYLTCGAIEGTGVLIERCYEFRFDHSKKADFISSIDPYDIQQALCGQLNYSVNGNQITLYYKDRKLYTYTSNAKYADDHATDSLIWIGEQMQYPIKSYGRTLFVTPGLIFPNSQVLVYNGLPKLIVYIQTDDIGRLLVYDVKVLDGWEYEGDYLDEDNSEPNLHIAFNRITGKYDVQIGIFRLTTLDDGIGKMQNGGMTFTATDANGNPIGGRITLCGDTANVCFTESTWPLLRNGLTFRYIRQK